jgi:hypothetical protein
LQILGLGHVGSGFSLFLMLPPFLMIYEHVSISILVWLAKDAGYLVSKSNPPVQTTPRVLNQIAICQSKIFSKKLQASAGFGAFV